ncbi:COP9 signalosome complex subunit 3, partial [Fragariocoptes setiger]
MSNQFASLLRKFTDQLASDNASLSQANFESLQELIIGCGGDEVRSVTGLFTTLCHELTQYLIKKKQSILGIDLLTRAISKIQSHSSQLTSVHSDLCQLCLDSKCLRPAIYFLDVEITDINKEDGHFDVKHLLLYYYYGGLIYAGMKNYDRALYFFEAVLTIPATVVSSIVVEAHKKHIILTLLLYGKLPEAQLPKYISPVVARHRRQLGLAYLKFANEYPSQNYERLQTTVNKYQQVYERDENMGLIKQCLAAVHKRNIKRLTRTFLTLSLTDVANHVGLTGEKEAESYIFQMIEEGEIFASINQKDGMVVFLDNPEKFNSASVFRQMQQDMETCMQLNERLRIMDQEIAQSPKYLAKLRAEDSNLSALC